MLLKTITFDANNSARWMNDRECNVGFLIIQERYINETIRYRGYMYLNEIYELLGIKWNPDDVNPCIKNDGVNQIGFIAFEPFCMPDNSVLIHIHRYD